MMQSIRKFAALTLLLLMGATSHALAWKTRGHEVVAIIAERHLTPAAKVEIRKLLSLEKQDSLADVANWADGVRLMDLPIQPSHATYLPRDARSFDEVRDCLATTCAVKAIRYFATQLPEPNRPLARLHALKYLVHLVGDLHQPLHALRLGGEFSLDGEQDTMHSIWDGAVVNSAGLKGDDLADLIEKTQTAPNSLGDPADWVWESFQIARDVILPDYERFRKKDPPEVPSTYPAENWPVAAARLEAAGMRLAWLLNGVLDPANPDQGSPSSNN